MTACGQTDSSQLRVAIAAPFPPPSGGMSVQAMKLCSRLTAEGFAVDAVPTNPQLPRYAGFLGSYPGARTLVREVQYLFSLFRCVCRCAIIHHLSASGIYFFLHSAPLLVLGRLWKRRLILNYRGGRAADFLSSWSWIVVPLMHLADRVAVPSEFLQRIFKRHSIESCILPNIADLELFPFRQSMEFAPRLLATRNLEPMYNVECALRAFRIVQNRFPHATLGIAGAGSEAKRLAGLVDEWRLLGVTFYGAVPHEKLPALYDQHDVYVNSSDVDNFPGALVEAACSGLVIVSTRAGGISDMIRDRESGLLVDLNDHEGLATAVLACLNDQDLARGLTRAARHWAEQFCWPKIFPRLMDCYGLSPALDSSLGQERAPIQQSSYI